MKLVFKLTLAFLFVALLILGGGGVLFVQSTQRAFESGFEQRVSAIADAVQERLGGTERDLQQALARIAVDPIITRELIEPLGRKRFYGATDVNYERSIVRDAERLMKSAVLDTLRIVDLERKGHLIALGHRAGFEETDPDLVELIEKHSDSKFFRYERIENAATGGTDAVWTLQVARLIEEPGVRVALVGGRIVDRRLVDDLRAVAGEGTAVVLVDVGERRVVATFEGAEPPPVPGGYASQDRAMKNPTSPGAMATLRVYVPRTELVLWREQLWETGAWFAGGAAGVALLMGFLIARRMSKPLEGLAKAAGEVAEGRRDVTVKPLKGRDEVAQLTRAFDQMTQDLVLSEERLRQTERVAAWSEIARRIAHEIKNPLSPIQMSIETLKKVWDRKHPDFEVIFRESTATVLEEVQRMKRIVSEFSDFARMPAPRPAPTDLYDVASQVVSLFKDTAPDVECKVVGVPLVLDVDGDQVRQALINLVKNGLEALTQAKTPTGAETAGEPKRLEVRVEREIDKDGERARIVVTDNGPGMSEITRQKLFTPYFTTKQAGTGLGLAITHRIVQEHGGRIRVDSELGVGTRFIVRLPGRTPGSPGRAQPS
ncbi:MAG: HAMP domain-containing protein [Deltaproteobacteria bacterium]|nr:HAMP domain-containing protein [Deltaproteobacteria bacterium]